MTPQHLPTAKIQHLHTGPLLHTEIKHNKAAQKMPVCKRKTPTTTPVCIFLHTGFYTLGLQTVLSYDLFKYSVLKNLDFTMLSP
jgi:hypothetical protein